MIFAIEIVIVFCTLVFSLIVYFKWAHKYWAKRNVPYLKPNLFGGNLNDVFQRKYGLSRETKFIYDEFKRRGDIHGGIYILHRPIYLPIDPELIKNVMTKDFQYFNGRGVHYDVKSDPLSGHLFNLDGDPWRHMRVKLTPTFTSGKMKTMFHTLSICGDPMIDHINNLAESGKSLDIKEIFGCYTTDIIGSCAFGIECNSFKDPNSEFRMNGRRMLAQSLSATFKRFATFAMPLARRFMYERLVSLDIQKFFIDAIKNIVDYRHTNKVNRHDFVQLLMEIQENVQSTKESFTIEEMAAQAFIFFIAGFETSSTTLTFCLHELAFNQDIQDKLREEIRETLKKYNGELTYDGIMEMKYMDQVVNETLRKYPPIQLIIRVCTKDYKVPNTDVIIEAGTNVFVSVLGLHSNEEYYPEPDVFDPERFNENNKANRHHYTFLPFGEGPRNCIGLRFGLMQAKTGLSSILNNFKILPAKTSNYKINYCPKSFILTSKEPLIVNAEKL